MWSLTVDGIFTAAARLLQLRLVTEILQNMYHTKKLMYKVWYLQTDSLDNAMWIWLHNSSGRQTGASIRSSRKTSRNRGLSSLKWAAKLRSMIQEQWPSLPLPPNASLGNKTKHCKMQSTTGICSFELRSWWAPSYQPLHWQPAQDHGSGELMQWMACPSPHPVCHLTLGCQP